MHAPHRLSFFLAVGVWLLSSLWWGGEQLSRVWGLWPHALSPSVVHGTVMVFGAMPLFFAGFLFTAGPKWLGVEAPSAHQLRWPLGLQAVGWSLWLLGAHHAANVSLGGLALAWLGLGWVQWRFGRLWHASRVPDRLHAQWLMGAGVWGWLCLGGVGVAVHGDEVDWALLMVRTGLWGCVGVTFVVVLHRMLPFFTSSALPMIHLWRPLWVLWFLLGVVALELLLVWLPWWRDVWGWHASEWRVVMWAVGLAQCGAGSVVLWLALAWGLVQSLRLRLLAMLHVGFVWLGLALWLGGASQLLGLREEAGTGVPVLGLGALHAMTMGCFGSLVLAMVTRVACGHGGRPLVADNAVWALFWGLQLAVLLRLVASVPAASPLWMLAAVAVWCAVLVAWGVRLMGWMGQPRADGRPG
jgi:uncharacterized protein involved in response to NO